MKVEEVMHSDENLEAMLGQFQISQPEGLNCENSNKIWKMCVNPNCEKPSLICNGPECDKCQGEDGEVHMCCFTILLKGVTAHLKKRATKQRDFIANIWEIENQFIN